MLQTAVRAARDVAPVAWETIDCPLCGSRDEEEVLAVPAEDATNTYHLVRCRTCGMGYLNPRPDAASIGRFYPDEYECYQSAGRVGSRARVKECLRRLVRSDQLGYGPPLTRWYEKALARAAGACLRRQRQSLTWLPFVLKGRMLDFGCGAGCYAHEMQRQGWNVTGLDMSAYTARQVRERFGIPVLVGSLPHPEIAPESFDLITMGMVLEHVHQPHDVIAAAARALRPGGRLAVVVPNLDSPLFPLFGRAWWPLELPRHLLHFTPATLRRLVAEHGLRVQQVQAVGEKGWVRRSFAVARRRAEREGGRLVAALGRLPGVPGLLARATAWTGRADAIKLVAEKAG